MSTISRVAAIEGHPGLRTVTAVYTALSAHRTWNANGGVRR